MPKTKRKINKKGTQKRNKNKLKKMNCNPTVKDTSLKGSCYTENALIHIRDAYNKNHTNKIEYQDGKQILDELRNRLDQCPREDCWLKQIKDDEARRQMDNIIFAPDRPNDWDKNPTSWLSNFDIGAVLKQYERSHPKLKLLGPSAIDYDTKLPEKNDKCVWDELCRLSLQNMIHRNKRKLGVVFNLDKHDGPGTHWVSMFVDLDNNIIFYYDSALNPVPREVSKLKNEIIEQGKGLDHPIQFKYMQNDYAHQSTNTECGMYSLFFIITFLTRKINRNIKNELQIGGSKKLSLQNVIDIFTKPGINDNMMIEYREKYFNKK